MYSRTSDGENSHLMSKTKDIHDWLTQSQDARNEKTASFFIKYTLTIIFCSSTIKLESNGRKNSCRSITGQSEVSVLLIQLAGRP